VERWVDDSAPRFGANFERSEGVPRPWLLGRPECPVDAIVIEEREAEPFDEEALKRHMAEANVQQSALPMADGGCPGSVVRQFDREKENQDGSAVSPSQLSHWPVQLALVPPTAPFLRGANLLLAADCVPFAMPDFHDRLLRGHPVVVGCPKLDDSSGYVAKLADILKQSSIRSLTIAHMEVPCCGGLCGIVKAAFESCGRTVPVREVTVSVDGRVLAEEEW